MLAENTAYLRGRDGVPVQARSAWLITLRDGRQTSLRCINRRPRPSRPPMEE